MSINAATLTINTVVKGGQIAITTLGAISAAAVAAGGAALRSYSDFERLGTSLESMVVRERRQRDGTLSMEAALRGAGAEAERLRGWMDKLAIDSPFKREGVAAAFQTAQGYGFISDSADRSVISAKRLTAALLDQAAATGRSEAVIGQIAYALGQANTTGRIYREEINQLTTAGVSAWDYLARATGKSTAEVQKMVSDGLIPADNAIRAIVEGIERDYGGAGKRQAATFSGLLSSLSDLGDVTGRNVFVGTFKAAQPVVADLVTRLQDERTQASIAGWGDAMGTFTAQALLGARVVPGIVGGWMADLERGKASLDGFFAPIDRANEQVSGYLDRLIGADQFRENLRRQFDEGLRASAAPVVIDQTLRLTQGWEASAAALKQYQDAAAQNRSFLDRPDVAQEARQLASLRNSQLADVRRLATGTLNAQQDAATREAIRQRGALIASETSELQRQLGVIEQLNAAKAQSGPAALPAITDQQRSAYSDLATLQVAYQEDSAKRAASYGQQQADIAAAYTTKLREIEIEKGRKLVDATQGYYQQLADIQRGYLDSVRANAEASAKEATGALGGLISTDVSYLQGVEDRRAEHTKKIEVLARQEARCRIPEATKAYAEEERQAARAYVQQEEAQRAHLGRLLVDYATAQAVQYGVGQGYLDQLTASIRQQYGIQQTAAERAFGAMRGSIDQWAASGGRGIDQVVAGLASTYDQTVKAQYALEQLQRQKADALADQYAAGKLTTDQYRQALADVPRAARAEVGQLEGGPVASERQVQLDQQTAQRRADAERSYVANVRRITTQWYAEQCQSAVTAYQEQIKQAATAYAAQEREALLSYGRQEAQLRASLGAMDALIRASTDYRLAEQVRGIVALNAALDRELARLLAIRDQFSPEEYDRRLRAILDRAARERAQVPGVDQALLPPDIISGGRYGGPRAAGGPAAVGYVYRVNELQQEYFAPLVPGYVVPRLPLPGSAPTMPRIERVVRRPITLQQHFHIAGGVDSAERVRQIATMAAQAARDAVLQALEDEADQITLEG